MTTQAQPQHADNGVNVEALLTARAALTEAPEGARFKWRATSQWINGTQSRATVDGFEQHVQLNETAPRSTRRRAGTERRAGRL